MAETVPAPMDGENIPLHYPTPMPAWLADLFETPASRAARWREDFYARFPLPEDSGALPPVSEREVRESLLRLSGEIRRQAKRKEQAA